MHFRLIILLDEVQEIRNIAHQKKFALFTIEFTLKELNLQQDVVSIDVIGDSSPSLALWTLAASKLIILVFKGFCWLKQCRPLFFVINFDFIKAIAMPRFTK